MEVYQRREIEQSVLSFVIPIFFYVGKLEFVELHRRKGKQHYSYLDTPWV